MNGASGLGVGCGCYRGAGVPKGDSTGCSSPARRAHLVRSLQTLAADAIHSPPARSTERLQASARMALRFTRCRVCLTACPGVLRRSLADRLRGLLRGVRQPVCSAVGVDANPLTVAPRSPPLWREESKSPQDLCRPWCGHVPFRVTAKSLRALLTTIIPRSAPMARGLSHAARTVLWVPLRYSASTAANRPASMASLRFFGR
jgi:hypothetical protein